MPDLSLPSVARWLADHDPPLASDIKSEATLPEAPPASDQLIRNLGDILDFVRDRAPGRLTEALASEPLRSSLKMVLAHLCPARRLRLLHWFCDPGMEDVPILLKGLTRPDERGEGQAIRDQVLDLNRSGLLAKIFHESRITALLDACRAVEEANS